MDGDAVLRERLALARGALVQDGYFRPEEIGDDIAPRIVEILSARDDAIREAAARGIRGPRDADHAGDWLYERAEEACAAGLPIEDALQAVRDGYSSVQADRAIAEDP
jgi:hypothetical protein